MRAIRDLSSAGVTSFQSQCGRLVTISGATLWWFLTLILLVGNDVVSNFVWNEHGYGLVVGLLSSVTVIHFLVGVLILIDSAVSNYRYWPLSSIYLTGQLFSVASLSSVLAFSFTIDDEHRGERLTMNAFSLFALTAFLGSSLSVTLEYLTKK